MFYKKPRIDKSLLKQYSEGLIVTPACCFGMAAQHVINARVDEAVAEIEALRSIFGEDFYLEIADHGIDEEQIVRDFYRNYGNDNGIKVVCTTDTHYLNYEDKEIHNIFKQLAYGSVGQDKDDGFIGDCFHVWTPEEVEAKFTREEMNNTLEIASKCNVSISHNEYHLPIFDLPSEYPNPYEYIGKLAWDGLKRIGKANILEYQERMKYELNILHLADLENYFLIVRDYVIWCKNSGIPIGPGRGCLTGEAQVLTDIGYKLLRDIEKDDIVFSHTGIRRKVLNTMKYNVSNEKLLSIKTEFSFNNINLTKDHKVYGKHHKLTKRYLNAIENNWKQIKCKKFEYDDLSWIKAEDIKKDDLIFTPWPKPLMKDIKNFIFKNNNIIFDNDFAYLIGRWIGNGWITTGKNGNYTFGIAFNSKDLPGIIKIKDIFSKKFNIELNENRSKTKKLVQLYCYNKDVVLFFKELFPLYKQCSNSKYIGEFKYIALDKLSNLLDGLMDSDGHVELNKNYSREYITTTSLQLALDIKESLLYIKIPCGIQTRKSYSDKKYIYNKSYKIVFKGIKLPKSKNNLFYEDGYCSKVIDISEHKEDFVYDITVAKDHSYLTSNYAVHNSMGSSLVGYCIGITSVDPIEYKLIFARGINAGRLLQLKFFDE